MHIYLCIYAYVSIVIVRYVVIYAVMNTHRFAHCADRGRHRLLIYIYIYIYACIYAYISMYICICIYCYS